MPSQFKKLALTMVLAMGFGAQVLAQYPPVPSPVENPLTPEKAILGKILFWDEQFSSTNSMACGTCHIPEVGGTDPRSGDNDSVHPGADGMFGTGDETIGSKGVLSANFGGQLTDDGSFFPNVQVTGRKTPSHMDAGLFTDMFWDGRATSEFIDPETGMVAIASGGALESQAVGPPLSNVEMAHSARVWSAINFKIDRVDPLRLATNIPADIQAALAVNPTYPALFNAAFGPAAPGDPLISAKRIAFAIASYERTLTSDQTPYDDFQAGNMAALTPAQQNGLMLFNGAGLCVTCHVGELFTAGDFRNIGITDPTIDTGRMAITGDPMDLGKFKVPGLRNVGLRENTGLFHHGTGNGSSLTSVVNFYNNGPNFTTNVDPVMLLAPLGLSAQGAADIADFLRNGLTDPRAQTATGIFSRPTLRSEVDALQNPLTASRFFFGTGMPHAGGNTPKMLVEGPPSRENSFFTIGIGDTTPNGTAYLLSGDFDFAGSSFGTPFPIHVTNNANFAITGILTSGMAPGAGFGSFTVPISNNPALGGFIVGAQWFVPDNGVVFGFASSEAVRLTVLP